MRILWYLLRTVLSCLRSFAPPIDAVDAAAVDWKRTWLGVESYRIESTYITICVVAVIT